MTQRLFRTMFAVLPLMAATSFASADSTPAPGALKKPNLCVTVRGNGFRLAAHFGALARVTEDMGMPDVSIGASSGSLTTFILESVAMNPYVSKDAQARKLEQSLLLKTMPAYLEAFLDERILTIVQDIASDKEKQAKVTKLAAGLSKGSIIEKIGFGLKSLIFSGTFRNLISVYTSEYFRELVNPELLKYRSDTGKIKSQAKKEKDPTKKAELEAIVKYRDKQLSDAFTAAGGFNVRTDPNFLFRPSALNHEGFVRVWDRFASFYAGYNFFREDEVKLQRFLRRCAPISAGKTFEEVVAADQECGKQFRSMARAYLRSYLTTFGSAEYPDYRDEQEALTGTCARYRYKDLMGKKLNSFVVTSAYLGDSAAKYKTMRDEFPTTTDPKFGERFTLKFSDFRIGFMGDVASFNKALSNIQGVHTDPNGRRLDFTGDFKTSIAIPLGRPTWQDAIVRSAAEPGQSGPKLMTDTEGREILSLGGWPDPTPTHILKGLGCETSIAIVTTLKTGSNFGEQVMARLMDDMTGIKEINDDEIAYGNLTDFTSDWGKWRNRMNPRGSEVMSYHAADAVFCTGWDDVDPFGGGLDKLDAGFRALLKESYQSKLYIPEDVSANHKIRMSSIPKITRADNVNDPKTNYPIYNGCVPPVRPN